MNNQRIPWELARQLEAERTQAPQRPLTLKEKALRKQSSIEAIAASSLAAVIDSRTKFTALQCVEFAFEAASLVVERAEAARDVLANTPD